MESFNSTLKNTLGEHFPNQTEAQAQLFDYIEVLYNQQLCHSSLGYKNPAQYERATCPHALFPETALAQTEFSSKRRYTALHEIALQPEQLINPSAKSDQGHGSLPRCIAPPA